MVERVQSTWHGWISSPSGPPPDQCTSLIATKGLLKSIPKLWGFHCSIVCRSEFSQSDITYLVRWVMRKSFYHPARLSCHVEVLKGQEKEKKKKKGTPVWGRHIWKWTYGFNQNELSDQGYTSLRGRDEWFSYFQRSLDFRWFPKKVHGPWKVCHFWVGSRDTNSSKDVSLMIAPTSMYKFCIKLVLND